MIQRLSRFIRAWWYGGWVNARLIDVFYRHGTPLGGAKQIKLADLQRLHETFEKVKVQ